MTDVQKQEIQTLRKEGMTYAAIAEQLELSVNTVKSYGRRLEIAKTLCRNCGKPLEQSRKTRPRSFCGDYCRREWWKYNRDKMKRKAECFRCAYCGQAFESYGRRNRKYCSHDCYIKARFGETAGE